MPIYSYFCDRCEKDFEVSKFMCECSTPENCPGCGHHAERDFVTDIKGIYHKGPIKTLGSLKDKNSGAFSDDYKHHLNNTQDDKELK